ncbi:hypothetical protein PVAND_015184 [Polypedilum vanderplanki]|uniref:C-type lectin domain-containing protein n=1 Tax=Polypedilum vanderplanki TaxID=319348 RepID=A0A9J6BCB6_POLVA|nr:hypothetical protein PVAND_015184 [Polypedilum vanderplanki]
MTDAPVTNAPITNAPATIAPSNFSHYKREPNTTICSLIVPLEDDCGYIKSLCYVSDLLNYNGARSNCLTNGMNLLKVSCNIIQAVINFFKNGSLLSNDFWANGVRSNSTGYWRTQPRNNTGLKKLNITEGPTPGDCLSLHHTNDGFNAFSANCSLLASSFCEYIDAAIIF